MTSIKLRFAIFIITAVSLCSCGLIQPSAQQLAEDVGPMPENYQKVVFDHIAARLKDPYSARFEFISPPNRGWVNRFGKLYVGWCGEVAVNAKNDYGAYVGARPYEYVIRHERVVFADETIANKLNRTPVSSY